MPAINYMEWFSRDPKVCGGQTVIKGTRVPLRTILNSVAEGGSVEEIVDDFPSVSPEAVRAAISFASASALEDIPVPPMPFVNAP